MKTEGSEREEMTKEEVVRRLEVYDIRKNPRLAALYPSHTLLHPHTRRCAVLMPLFFSSLNGQLHVLLTQRASNLRTHASNVAFPGGVQDPIDKDDTHTALREAQEEVGLRPEQVNVVAHLPPTFVFNKNSVFPVVGFIPEDFQPVPNPEEVSKVFSVPLKDVVDKDKVTFTTYKILGKKVRSPVLTVTVGNESIIVWGATLHMCILLARTIIGPFKRYRILLPDDNQEKWCDDEEDKSCDDNVYGDMEILYQYSCNASRPSAHL